MIRVQQHAPGWSNDGEGGQTAEVPDQEALLAIQWVALWGFDDLVTSGGGLPFVRPFYRWSLADRRSRPSLMAEYDEGRHYWVVAHVLEGVELLDLPEWVMHPEARERLDRWNRGETT